MGNKCCRCRKKNFQKTDKNGDLLVDDAAKATTPLHPTRSSTCQLQAHEIDSADKHRVEQELKKLFTEVDKFKAGRIAADRLKIALEKLGFVELSPNHVTDMIASIDRSGDGKINADEFVQLITQRPSKDHRLPNTISFTVTETHFNDSNEKKVIAKTGTIYWGHSLKDSGDDSVREDHIENTSKKPISAKDIKATIIDPNSVKESQHALSDFRRWVLHEHNAYRQKHAADPLSLDADLNATAQNWAQHMAETGAFNHSVRRDLGENIFYGKMPAGVKPEDVVKSWYEEVSKYSPDKPELNATRAGHFTQLVWKSSRFLGVGWVQRPDFSTYVVCTYQPPGNVQGHFKENVSCKE